MAGVQRSGYIKGLVSVVIPTYKRSDMLMRAIQSVLGQTYSNLELIVVNDNEIGDQYSLVLYDLISKVKDDRLIFIEQQKHINGAAARNVGIRKARGEYIAFQDDDDYWDAEKLERQVKLIESLDDSYGAVACMKRFYNGDKFVRASLPFTEKNLLLHIVEQSASLGTGAVLIRRTALDDAGYFDETLKRHQDVQLFARLASKYRIKLDRVYLQNREDKDTQNRPTADQLREIKSAFYSSVEDIIDLYPARTKRRIYALHNYQTAYRCFAEKQYLAGVQSFLIGLSSPSASFIEAKLVIERLISSRCKNLLVKRYGY